MGRLTLNMLLSFAQFEREVTGERIRDKIAASKRKGMWMGGSVPLGYAVQDRKLAVEQTEAALVRHIYQLYLNLGTVRLVQEQLARSGVTGKAGQALGRGALFHMLQNRIYRGEVVHRGNVYPGEHQAIIDAELWEAVQRRLAEGRAERRFAGNASHPSMLAGMLTDPANDPMIATHASKSGRRYRYYVSSRLVTGTRPEHADALRVPAAALERIVVGRITRLLTDGPELLNALRTAEVLPPEGAVQRRLLTNAQQLAQRWGGQSQAEQRRAMQALGVQIAVQRRALAIRIAARRLLALLTGATTSNGDEVKAEADLPLIIITEPVALRRAGREMALLVGSSVPATQSDPSLVRLIAKAWSLREALVRSSAPSLTAFAAEQRLSQSYVTRLVRLAWLAPDLVEAIIDGRQPAGLTASQLMRDTRLPTDWDEQRKALGFV